MSAKFAQCKIKMVGGLALAVLAGTAFADDFSAIHGYWQGFHTACGTWSDDFVDIDAKGAQFFESTCRLISATKTGDQHYVLVQKCEGFEEETWDMTIELRLTAGDRLSVDGSERQRCPRP